MADVFDELDSFDDASLSDIEAAEDDADLADAKAAKVDKMSPRAVIEASFDGMLASCGDESQKGQLMTIRSEWIKDMSENPVRSWDDYYNTWSSRLGGN